MDVHGAEVVAEVGGAETADGGCGVHDTEEPEGAHGVWLGVFVNHRAAVGGVPEADAGVGRPLLEVEEDGIEAEEEEGNGGAEPSEGVVAESMGVDPDADSCPALGLAEGVSRVGAGDEDCE